MCKIRLPWGQLELAVLAIYAGFYRAIYYSIQQKEVLQKAAFFFFSVGSTIICKSKFGSVPSFWQ